MNRISQKARLNFSGRRGLWLAAIGALLALSGCASQSIDNSAFCQFNYTKNVDEAFAQVSNKLDSSACHYYFDDYMQELLTIAKGAPGRDNQERFANLLRSSIDRGVISKNCASLQNKPAIYASMKRELRMKKQGLLDISNDAQGFRRAQSHYENMQHVFDAVALACTRDI